MIFVFLYPLSEKLDIINLNTVIEIVTLIVFGSAMIKRYIWPFIEPFFNNKAFEPLLVLAGSTIIIAGLVYTVAQTIL